MTGDESLAPDQIAAEIARVQRLIDARTGKPSYTQNVTVLNARMAELIALQAPPEPQPNV